MHTVVNLLFRRFGHRICCGAIPEWTAHVGRAWSDERIDPFNLYDVIWWLRQQLIWRNLD